MKNERVPWSWLALAVSALPLGGVMIFGLYFTQLFRGGIDADMSFFMFSTPLHEYLLTGAILGIFGLPFLVASWCLANGTSRPGRNFYLIAAALPTTLLFAGQVLGLVGGALEGPSPVPPFEADNLLYLPNWLSLATTAAAFFAGVWGYLGILRAKRSPASA